MTGINPQFRELQAALEFTREAHIVTGQNLANVNTPEFKTREIPFEQLLKRLDQPQNTNSLQPFEHELTDGLPVRADGNNVDLDRELTKMKKNALAYQTLTQLLGAKMSILKQAISR